MKPAAALTALAVTLATSLLSAQPAELPVYTYAIRSGHFQEGGMLLQSINEPIPGTIWRCAITYLPAGVSARCNLPGDVGGVAIQASCAVRRQDGQTVNLSNLDGGYASVMVGCQQLDKVDDGF